MRLVLVDTASPAVGVAAYGEGGCLGTWTATLGAGADAWLTPALAEALAAAGEVVAVAAITGPGAFTGLRVGLAHALGLALARGVPVIPVPSLQLRAAAAPGHAEVLVLLDARKGRLYAQRFDTRGPTPVPLAPPEDVAPEALAAAGLAGVVAVGEGVGVAAAVLSAHGALVVPLAADAALRAAGPLLAQLPRRDAAAVTPEYIREPDARPPAGLPPVMD